MRRNSEPRAGNSYERSELELDAKSEFRNLTPKQKTSSNKFEDVREVDVDH